MPYLIFVRLNPVAATMYPKNDFLQVRAMWTNIREFFHSTSESRDVIDSIVEGSADAARIDATELDVRIPDLLLRECEKEIQRVSACDHD